MSLEYTVLDQKFCPVSTFNAAAAAAATEPEQIDRLARLFEGEQFDTRLCLLR